MKSIASAITDVKGEFEGGSSFKVDWYTLFRRGGENLLSAIRPDSLKRVVPIYAGLSRHIGDSIAVQCPEDVLVPSAIYDNSGKRIFSFPPPGAFYNTANRAVDNQFTIETINGVQYIVVRKNVGLGEILLNNMDSTSGLVSDQTLTLNQFNYIDGAGAVQRSFSPKSGTACTADASSNELTSSSHGLSNGDRVMVYNSGGALPTGLSADTVYFVVNSATNTFKLSTTSGGSAIDITTAGTGTHYWYAATQNEISDVITATDITTALFGVATVSAYISSASDIDHLELVLEEDEGNYRTLTSTADSIGDHIRDGWNQIRFSLQNAVQTGTPDSTNTLKWRLRCVLATGATPQTIVIDKISLHRSQFFMFEYYSKYLFKDGTTGAWKKTPVSGDFINLDDDDALGALHYEVALLTYQATAFNRVDNGEQNTFETNLARKYKSYKARKPSSELPPSYSISPMLGRSTLPFIQRIGEFVHAETSTSDISGDASYFADSVTPSGTIDSVNATFTLPHTPNPVSSLMLYLNGTLQTQGVDYTISGSTITYVTAPSSFLSGAPHVAFYRYSS